MSSEVYEEYNKRRKPSSTWNYFLTSLDRKTAKCKICTKIVATNGASTSGLHAHLKTKHGIKLELVQKRNMSYSRKYENDDENGEHKSPTKIDEISRSGSYFAEYANRQNSPSLIWNHFLRSMDGENAKCKICSKVLKTSGASTSGLHSHLKSQHKINLLNRMHKRRTHKRSVVKKEIIVDIPISIIKQEADQTSLKDSELESGYNDVDMAQDNFEESSFHLENSENVNEKLSPMKIISRMVALDGIPLSSFCDSCDLGTLLSQSGYELPSSDIETISMILEQSDTVKIEITNELKQFKLLGLKFCLNFEEFITLNNKTYISINVYNEDTTFGGLRNLGLLKIKRSMENEEIIKLISEKLQVFDINLHDDIISITSSISLSQINLELGLELEHQLCLAQAVQYGVLEVLYKEDDSHVNENTEASDDSDTEYNNIERKNAFFVNYPENITEPQLIYKDIIEKVRKLVRYYKNSAARNKILQNNVRKKHDQEINLILDCKKRWSSLCEMIGRFLKLKDCIHESLTYLEMDLFINDEELQILNEIHDSLVVIKATVTALCKPNGNLLTADAALRFMLRKLDAQNNTISCYFASAIRKHIKRRRTILSSILQYLHDRHSYEKNTNDYTFIKPTSEEIVDKILTLLTRLKPFIEDKSNIFDYRSKTIARRILDPLETEGDDEISIEKQLENEINTTCHNEIPKPAVDLQELDLKKIILGEMSIYDSAGGTRGLYLTEAYDLLLSVMPAPLEAEHYFYSRKYVHKKISCHPEVLLNSLFLLRAYFKEQRKLDES